MNEPPDAAVPSPCIGGCHLDRARGVCSGCARTSAEIAAWRAMDDRQRLAVWARLGRTPTRAVRSGDGRRAR